MVADGGGSGSASGELSRILDLLDEQHRRILELSSQVRAGQRRLRCSTTALAWRSPARFGFDGRLRDLHQTLARSALALGAALNECDRARDLVRSRFMTVGAANQDMGVVSDPARGLR